MLKLLVLPAALVLIAMLAQPRPAHAAAPHASGDNLALDKPYTISVAPNYALCTDEGDAVQLTDGERPPEKPGSGFWADPATVGWNHVREPIAITIDLGEVQPIAGAAVYSGAGASGVAYPRTVAVLVSDDGENFHLAGDLVRLTEEALPPAYGQQSRYGYRATSLNTRGRYVRIVLGAASVFLFCDEIEVFRGDEALLDEPLPGEPVELASLVEPDRLTQLGAYTRIRSDAEAVQKLIGTITLEPALHEELTGELDAVLAALNESEQVVEPEGFRAIVPFNDLHARVFAVYGRILAAGAGAAVTVWHSEPYRMLELFERPGDPLRRLSIAAMQNERRAEVVNLTNASGEPRQVRVSFEQGGADLHVDAVQYVDTREGKVVHSALLPLSADERGVYTTTVPAGMTRQLWLTFEPRSLPAGTHRETLRLQSDGLDQTVALELEVAPLRFPDQATLAFSGWDYIIGKNYQITDANQDAARRAMQESLVNGVWGSAGQLPVASASAFDEAGNLTGELDFTEWDRFVEYFPGMRHYLVFAYKHPNQNFAGKPEGSPAFDRALAQYAAAWEAHNRTLGLKPGQVIVLFVDEPVGEDYFTASYRYGKAFGEGSDEILTFTDPHISSVNEELGRRNNSAYDIVCPHLPAFATQDETVRDAYAALAQNGQALWFYSCSGPTRHFDPSYYRYQPWYGFRYGATGSGFWAFGDAGGATSWNEYTAIGHTAYTPLYLGRETVDRSKHWAAANEGVQDYEYLHMLTQRVAELKGSGKDPALQGRIERLLSTLPDETLARLQGADPATDRHSASRFAEQGRRQALQLLVETAE